MSSPTVINTSTMSLISSLGNWIFHTQRHAQRHPRTLQFFFVSKEKKVWEKGSPQEDHHLTWAHRVILNKSEAKWSIFFLHWDPSCLLRCCRGSTSRDDNMMMGCGLFGRLGRGSSLHFSLSYYFKSLGIGPHKRLTRRVELNQSVGLAGREQRKRGDPEKRCPFCHTS